MNAFGIRGRDGSLRDWGSLSVTAETAGGTSIEWVVRIVMRVAKKARMARRSWKRRGGMERVMGRPQQVLWVGMMAVAGKLNEETRIETIAGESLYTRENCRKG